MRTIKILGPSYFFACVFNMNFISSDFLVFCERFLFLSRSIGVGRFRILGGAKVRNFGGAKGGPNSQQAHDVVTTSMRRNVASTSFRRRVPTRLLINQCQIITFLILKYDIIQHSRIELRGIVLPVQVGGLLGGGGQRVCWPPSQIIGGPGPPLPPPLPTPMRSQSVPSAV